MDGRVLRIEPQLRQGRVERGVAMSNENPHPHPHPLPNSNADPNPHPNPHPHPNPNPNPNPDQVAMSNENYLAETLRYHGVAVRRFPALAHLRCCDGRELCFADGRYELTLSQP